MWMLGSVGFARASPPGLTCMVQGVDRHGVGVCFGHAPPPDCPPRVYTPRYARSAECAALTSSPACRCP
eukprot:2235510-Pyramimonas_sp.AAC.1